jgi:hypothetical protein
MVPSGTRTGAGAAGGEEDPAGAGQGGPPCLSPVHARTLRRARRALLAPYPAILNAPLKGGGLRPRRGTPCCASDDPDVWLLVGELESAIVTGQLAEQARVDLCAEHAVTPDTASVIAALIRRTIADRGAGADGRRRGDAGGGRGRRHLPRVGAWSGWCGTSTPPGSSRCRRSAGTASPDARRSASVPSGRDRPSRAGPPAQPIARPGAGCEAPRSGPRGVRMAHPAWAR